jgi:hypothetical protein
MKKIISFIFLSYVLSPALLAQTKLNPKAAPQKINGIKINILSPAYNAITLSYQHLLYPYHSFQFTFTHLEFAAHKSLVFSSNESRLVGQNYTLDYRYNLTGYGINGTYIGAYSRLMNYERNSNERAVLTQHIMSSLGFGFVVGKQFLFKNTILLDTWFGLGNQINLKSETIKNGLKVSSTEDEDYTGKGISNSYIFGSTVRAGISVGFAF